MLTEDEIKVELRKLRDYENEFEREVAEFRQPFVREYNRRLDQIQSQCSHSKSYALREMRKCEICEAVYHAD